MKELRPKTIILRPLVTEKSTRISASLRPGYTFLINPGATKKEVELAVKKLYKVNSVAIRIVKLPAKKVFVRGKRGITSAKKKAIVYLKAGDKIEFV